MGGFDAIVEEGSAGGSYTDGFVVPVPEGKRDAYRELASKMAKVFRQHAVEEIVLRVVLANVSEAEEAPASGPVEIGGLERRLVLAGLVAAGDSAMRLRPFDPPVHPALFRRH